MCNPDIFRTLVYPELRQIQNQRHIQNPGIFRTLSNIYDGALEKQLTAIIIFASYEYFRKIFFRVHEINEINMIF